tara:strand:+ start:6112 stop:7179 length:1068 start_codon:yes stop_codon:yes gene_type:complete
MKRLIIIFLIIFIQCSKSDDSSNSIESIAPGINLYIAGYINDETGNTIACYWQNGKRFDLGEGELTDITVSQGKVYTTGYSFGGGASYWIDDTAYNLEGNDPEAYSIDIHNGDVYVAGRDNGACYWKNGDKIKLSGGDSSAYGIAVRENGDIFAAGYYVNNHHFIIPAVWKNGKRVNLSVPKHGDGEVKSVKISDGTPYYFGMTMKPNNMIGYVPKASYWKGGKRTDLTNGGGFNQSVYGGEGNGGFVSEGSIYVAGMIDHIAEADENGETIVGSGGTYAHYWVNGDKVDLQGGQWNNMWVSTAYDIAVSDDVIIVSGDVATNSQTQVPAVWVNNELVLLEGDNTHGIAKTVFID